MITKSWDIILKEEYNKEYFHDLVTNIREQYKNKIIFPESGDIFNAFRLTEYEDIKIVILGQDPYHGVGEAHGLAFSVKSGVRKPPSLNNIFKEMRDDLGYPIPETGNLDKWAKNGVLLLNTILTVEKDTPLSHKKYGWETFTDEIISIINKKKEPVVFILWGSYARSKKELINNPNHFIIESPHPSPFSANRGFFGSKPFSKANKFLQSKKVSPVDFKLD